MDTAHSPPHKTNLRDDKMNFPETKDFCGGELVEVSHLEKSFDISRKVALKYLQVLKIKPLYFGTKVFYSLPTFNRIMYVLTRPGSPGFLFPASTGKNNAGLRAKGFLVEVTDEILKEASSPRTLAEMLAASGQDVSMIKKLISQSNVESKKPKIKND